HVTGVQTCALPIYRVARNESGRRVDQLVEVAFDKGLRFDGGHHLSGVDGLSVVADASRPPGKVGGQLRIAGADHAPAVDKDLRADLFGDDLSVELGGAALGSGDAPLEP